MKSEPKVFLDPNKMSDDGTTSISATAYSEDGKFMAYGYSEKGSDWVTVKVKNIPDGTDLEDVLTRLKFTSLEWTHDNKGFFYNVT